MATKPKSPVRTSPQSGLEHILSTAKPTPPRSDKQIAVWATQMGFYGGSRIRPGQNFVVYEKDFSAKWMSKTDPNAPKALVPEAEAAGDDDPIGAGE